MLDATSTDTEIDDSTNAFEIEAQKDIFRKSRPRNNNVIVLQTAENSDFCAMSVPNFRNAPEEPSWISCPRNGIETTFIRESEDTSLRRLELNPAASPHSKDAELMQAKESLRLMNQELIQYVAKAEWERKLNASNEEIIGILHSSLEKSKSDLQKLHSNYTLELLELESSEYQAKIELENEKQTREFLEEELYHYSSELQFTKFKLFHLTSLDSNPNQSSNQMDDADPDPNPNPCIQSNKSLELDFPFDLNQTPSCHAGTLSKSNSFDLQSERFLLNLSEESIMVLMEALEKTKSDLRKHESIHRTNQIKMLQMESNNWQMFQALQDENLYREECEKTINEWIQRLENACTCLIEEMNEKDLEICFLKKQLEDELEYRKKAERELNEIREDLEKGKNAMELIQRIESVEKELNGKLESLHQRLCNVQNETTLLKNEKESLLAEKEAESAIQRLNEDGISELLNKINELHKELMQEKSKRWDESFRNLQLQSDGFRLENILGDEIAKRQDSEFLLSHISNKLDSFETRFQTFYEKDSEEKQKFSHSFQYMIEKVDGMETVLKEKERNLELFYKLETVREEKESCIKNLEDERERNEENIELLMSVLEMKNEKIGELNTQLQNEKINNLSSVSLAWQYSSELESELDSKSCEIQRLEQEIAVRESSLIHLDEKMLRIVSKIESLEENYVEKLNELGMTFMVIKMMEDDLRNWKEKFEFDQNLKNDEIERLNIMLKHERQSKIDLENLLYYHLNKMEETEYLLEERVQMISSVVNECFSDKEKDREEREKLNLMLLNEKQSNIKLKELLDSHLQKEEDNESSLGRKVENISFILKENYLEDIKKEEEIRRLKSLLCNEKQINFDLSNLLNNQCHNIERFDSFSLGKIRDISFILQEYSIDEKRKSEELERLNKLLSNEKQYNLEMKQFLDLHLDKMEEKELVLEEKVREISPIMNERLLEEGKKDEEINRLNALLLSEKESKLTTEDLFRNHLSKLESFHSSFEEKFHEILFNLVEHSNKEKESSELQKIHSIELAKWEENLNEATRKFKEEKNAKEQEIEILIMKVEQEKEKSLHLVPMLEKLLKILDDFLINSSESIPTIFLKAVEAEKIKEALVMEKNEYKIKVHDLNECMLELKAELEEETNKRNKLESLLSEQFERLSGFEESCMSNIVLLSKILLEKEKLESEMVTLKEVTKRLNECIVCKNSEISCLTTKLNEEEGKKLMLENLVNKFIQEMGRMERSMHENAYKLISKISEKDDTVDQLGSHLRISEENLKAFDLSFGNVFEKLRNFEEYALEKINSLRFEMETKEERIQEIECMNKKLVHTCDELSKSNELKSTELSRLRVELERNQSNINSLESLIGRVLDKIETLDETHISGVQNLPSVMHSIHCENLQKSEEKWMKDIECIRIKLQEKIGEENELIYWKNLVNEKSNQFETAQMKLLQLNDELMHEREARSKFESLLNNFIQKAERLEEKCEEISLFATSLVNGKLEKEKELEGVRLILLDEKDKRENNENLMVVLMDRIEESEKNIIRCMMDYEKRINEEHAIRVELEEALHDSSLQSKSSWMKTTLDISNDDVIDDRNSKNSIVIVHHEVNDVNALNKQMEVEEECRSICETEMEKCMIKLNEIENIANKKLSDTVRKFEVIYLQYTEKIRQLNKAKSMIDDLTLRIRECQEESFVDEKSIREWLNDLFSSFQIQYFSDELSETSISETNTNSNSIFSSFSSLLSSQLSFFYKFFTNLMQLDQLKIQHCEDTSATLTLSNLLHESHVTLESEKSKCIEKEKETEILTNCLKNVSTQLGKLQNQFENEQRKVFKLENSVVSVVNILEVSEFNLSKQIKNYQLIIEKNKGEIFELLQKKSAVELDLEKEKEKRMGYENVLSFLTQRIETSEKIIFESFSNAIDFISFLKSYVETEKEARTRDQQALTVILEKLEETEQFFRSMFENAELINYVEKGLPIIENRFSVMRNGDEYHGYHDMIHDLVIRLEESEKIIETRINPTNDEIIPETLTPVLAKPSGSLCLASAETHEDMLMKFKDSERMINQMSSEKDEESTERLMRDKYYFDVLTSIVSKTETATEMLSEKLLNYEIALEQAKEKLISETRKREETEEILCDVFEITNWEEIENAKNLVNKVREIRQSVMNSDIRIQAKNLDEGDEEKQREMGSELMEEYYLIKEAETILENATQKFNFILANMDEVDSENTNHHIPDNDPCTNFVDGNSHRGSDELSLLQFQIDREVDGLKNAEKILLVLSSGMEQIEGSLSQKIQEMDESIRVFANDFVALEEEVLNRQNMLKNETFFLLHEGGGRRNEYRDEIENESQVMAMELDDLNLKIVQSQTLILEYQTALKEHSDCFKLCHQITSDLIKRNETFSSDLFRQLDALKSDSQNSDDAKDLAPNSKEYAVNEYARLKSAKVKLTEVQKYRKNLELDLKQIVSTLESFEERIFVKVFEILSEFKLHDGGDEDDSFSVERVLVLMDMADERRKSKSICNAAIQSLIIIQEEEREFTFDKFCEVRRKLLSLQMMYARKLTQYKIERKFKEEAEDKVKSLQQELTESRMLLEIRQKVNKSLAQSLHSHPMLPNELEKMIIEKEKDNKELMENAEGAINVMIDSIEINDLKLNQTHARWEAFSELTRMEMAAIDKEMQGLREERDSFLCALEEERMVRIDLENRILELEDSLDRACEKILDMEMDNRTSNLKARSISNQVSFSDEAQVFRKASSFSHKPPPIPISLSDLRSEYKNNAQFD